MERTLEGPFGRRDRRHWKERLADAMWLVMHLHLQADQLYPFDARGVAKRFRHAAIFGALDSLRPGETMRFMNDHDPLPLLDQLRERYGDDVAIEYVKREYGEVVIDFKRL
jgi:uncharacterized protein (DUF2249 family)